MHAHVSSNALVALLIAATSGCASTPPTSPTSSSAQAAVQPPEQRTEQARAGTPPTASQADSAFREPQLVITSEQMLRESKLTIARNVDFRTHALVSLRTLDELQAASPLDPHELTGSAEASSPTRQPGAPTDPPPLSGEVHHTREANGATIDFRVVRYVDRSCPCQGGMRQPPCTNRPPPSDALSNSAAADTDPLFDVYLVEKAFLPVRIAEHTLEAPCSEYLRYQP